jgi:phosphoribosylaminoimidazolecarboxamide formyltransferase/IMP cyclohydrolase
MITIKKALISVSNKKDIVEFAKALTRMDVEILSTGGTAKALKDAGVSVKEVSEYTGFPEMLDGRVKTLHPKIHGGLLSRRDKPEDMEEIKKHGIDTIDMVVVNLYPFKETISKPGVTFTEAIENIDIGGPTMLRSASKNFQDVTVIVDPSDYKKIIREMKKLKGGISYKTRLGLAKKVFKRTSQYDKAIAAYLAKVAKEQL